MYEIYITPSAKKIAKKLPKEVRVKAVQATDDLKSNPYVGQKLTGPLFFLYSFHFKVKGKEYRIAYTVDTEKNLIVIHLIDIREGFYPRLKRLFS